MSHRLPSLSKPFEEDQKQNAHTKTREEDLVSFGKKGKTAKMPQLELMQLGKRLSVDPDNLDSPRG